VVIFVSLTAAASGLVNAPLVLIALRSWR
jgi:hypothetical protein